MLSQDVMIGACTLRKSKLFRTGIKKHSRKIHRRIGAVTMMNATMMPKQKKLIKKLATNHASEMNKMPVLPRKQTIKKTPRVHLVDLRDGSRNTFEIITFVDGLVAGAADH